MSKPHCAACPVAAGTYCASGHHPRYCDLAAMDREALRVNPGHDPYWLRYLVDNTAQPEQPKPCADREANIARLAETRLLVLGCDYRGPQDGQGCNCRNICFARKGTFDPHLVSMGDCLACVSEKP